MGKASATAGKNMGNTWKHIFGGYNTNNSDYIWLFDGIITYHI
jgi:hypothetical protein